MKFGTQFGTKNCNQKLVQTRRFHSQLKIQSGTNEFESFVSCKNREIASDIHERDKVNRLNFSHIYEDF